MFKEVPIDDKVKVLIAENFVRNITQSAISASFNKMTKKLNG